MIWDIDEAWVYMSLTGQETPPIQDKEDSSDILDKGEEVGWISPSESVLIYGR